MFLSQEELKKAFYETTLPNRLVKFDALLKGQFFVGDKVRHTIMCFLEERIKQPNFKEQVALRCDRVRENKTAYSYVDTYDLTTDV